MSEAGGSGFVFFGVEHVAALSIILVVCIAFPLAVRRFGGNAERRVAVALASILVVYEITKSVIRVTLLDMPLAENLPLHLCAVEVFLVAWVLARRSYGAFEVAYFWGMAGTLQAVLTPDLSDGFPSFAFVAFFTGHGLALTGLAYALIVFRFRPTLYSVFKALAVTLVYAIPVGLLNIALGTNYLYLMHRPARASILDFFGPWPAYLPWLALIGVAACFIVYLPFAVARSWQRNG